MREEEYSHPLNCACIDLIEKQSPPFHFFIFSSLFCPFLFSFVQKKDGVDLI